MKTVRSETNGTKKLLLNRRCSQNSEESVKRKEKVSFQCLLRNRKRAAIEKSEKQSTMHAEFESGRTDEEKVCQYFGKDAVNELISKKETKKETSSFQSFHNSPKILLSNKRSLRKLGQFPKRVKNGGNYQQSEYYVNEPKLKKMQEKVKKLEKQREMYQKKWCQNLHSLKRLEQIMEQNSITSHLQIELYKQVLNNLNYQSRMYKSNVSSTTAADDKNSNGNKSIINDDECLLAEESEMSSCESVAI